GPPPRGARLRLPGGGAGPGPRRGLAGGRGAVSLHGAWLRPLPRAAREVRLGADAHARAHVAAAQLGGRGRLRLSRLRRGDLAPALLAAEAPSRRHGLGGRGAGGGRRLRLEPDHRGPGRGGRDRHPAQQAALAASAPRAAHPRERGRAAAARRQRRHPHHLRGHRARHQRRGPPRGGRARAAAGRHPDRRHPGLRAVALVGDRVGVRPRAARRLRPRARHPLHAREPGREPRAPRLRGARRPLRRRLRDDLPRAATGVMRLDVDGRELVAGARTGIGRYLREVLRAAAARGWRSTVYGDANTVLEDAPAGVTLTRLAAPGTRWWDQVALPLALRRSGADVARARYRLGGSYVLSVGNFMPHKNLEGLLRAWASLPPTLRAAHRLVLAGGDAGRRPRLETLTRALGVTASVVFPGRIDDADLPGLYSACAAFVLPSLDEGFGLPAVEAMACGAPVIVSDRGALPEVAGPGAAVVDAAAEGALAAALARV